MLTGLRTRLQRLGLQRRIMLYVTLGLAVFFVISGYVALQAIEQSIDLVYRERLLAASAIGHAIDQRGTAEPAAIAAILTDLDLEQTDYVVEVIDRSGALLAHLPPSTNLTRSYHLDLVAPMWNAGEVGVTRHAVPGGEHVIAFAPLRRQPWAVIVEQRGDRAFALPRMLQQQFIAFGLIAVTAGLLFAWLTTRAVVQPVSTLIHATNDIARGALDRALDVSGADEVGTLARAFDEMRVALRASRAEIARWNLELETRVQQRTRELAALVESSRALTSTLELDELLQIVMQQTRDVLPLAEGIALFLHDEAAQALAVRSSYGLERRESELVRFGAGEGIAGRVFESQASLLLPNAQAVQSYQANLSAANRLHFRRATGERPVISALGVLLAVKGVRMGVLMLYNFSRENAFREGDVPLLQALANQAAAALDNARLYREAGELGALREIDRLKTEFVARASHELRTPLTSIKSLAETLLRPELELGADTRREFLLGIDSAADRLTSIMNDLLVLARMDQGRLAIKGEPLPLPEIVQRVVAQFRAQFPSHRFANRLAPDVPLVLGDPDRIEDVLTNLLSNAVKYSAPGTEVLLSAQVRGVPAADPGNGTAAPGDFVVVSVADEGIGIPVEQRARVFEGFYRVDNAPTGRGGAGLGLYICKRFVEAMGGRIWIEDGDGHGTVVSFSLQIA